MSIGENIKRIRTEKNMTQKELGEKLGGVSQQQIGRWESGKANPKKETIEKIAIALETDPFSLYSFDMATSELNSAINKKHSLVPQDVDIKFTTIREYKDFCAFIGQYDGDDYTKEDIEEIKHFAEFLKSKRRPTTDTPPQD